MKSNIKLSKRLMSMMLSLLLILSVSGSEFAFAVSPRKMLDHLIDNSIDIGVKSEGYDVDDYEKSYDITANIWIPDSHLKTGGTVWINTKVYNSERLFDGKAPFRISGAKAKNDKATVHFDYKDFILEDENPIEVDGVMVNPAAVKFDNLNFEHANLQNQMNFYARGAKLVMGGNLDLEESGTITIDENGRYVFVPGKCEWNIFGGSEHNSITTKSKTNIVIAGGTWNDVYGGGGENASCFTGTHVTLLDGNIKKICGGGNDNSNTGLIDDNNSKTIIDIHGGFADSIIGGSEVDENSNIMVNNDIEINVDGGHVNTINLGNDYYTPMRHILDNEKYANNIRIMNTSAVAGKASVNIYGSGNVKKVIGDEYRNVSFGSVGEDGIGGYRRIKGVTSLNIAASNSFEDMGYFDVVNITGDKVELTSSNIVGDDYIGRINLENGATLHLKNGGIINKPYNLEYENSDDISIKSLVKDAIEFVLVHGFKIDEKSTLKINGNSLTEVKGKTFDDEGHKCGLRIYGQVEGQGFLSPDEDPKYSKDGNYYYYVVAEKSENGPDCFKSVDETKYTVMCNELKANDGTELYGWYLKEVPSKLTYHPRQEAVYGEDGHKEYYSDENGNLYIFNPVDISFEQIDNLSNLILHYPNYAVIENVKHDTNHNIYSFDKCVYCSDEDCKKELSRSTIPLILHDEDDKHESYFTDLNGNIYIFDEEYNTYIENQIIPMKDIEYTYVGQNDPDVNNDGEKEHYVDQDGNKYIIDGDTFIKITKENEYLLVIPKIKVDEVQGKAADVNNEGIKTHYVDADGNKYILSEGIFIEVEDKDLYIPKIPVVYIKEILPTVNSTGVKGHYVDEQNNKYLKYNGLYVKVKDEDLIIDKLYVELIDEKSPTANEYGEKAHYEDENGKKYIFDGNEYVLVSDDDLRIQKLTLNYVEQKDATVNSEGLKAHYRDQYGKRYILEDGIYIEVTLDQLRIEKTALEFVDQINPTVNQEGTKAHYIDLNGNVYILENDQYVLVTMEQLKIEKLAVTKIDLVEASVNSTGVKEHFVDKYGNKYILENNQYVSVEDTDLIIDKNVVEFVKEVQPTVNDYGVAGHYIDEDGTIYIKVNEKYEQTTLDALRIEKIKVNYVSQLAATVNNYGVKAHYIDSYGNKYILQNQKYILVSDEELKIPKLHVYYVQRMEPTVNDYGMEGHYIDDNGKLYILSDNRYINVSSEYLKLDRLTVEKINEISATVNSTGVKEHYIDKSGNKYIKKNGIYTEVTDNGLIIPKLEVIHLSQLEPTVNSEGYKSHYIDKYERRYLLNGNIFVEVEYDDLVIEKIPVEYVNEKPASVNKDGIKAHYIDLDGNKYLLNDGKYIKVTDSKLRIHIEPTYIQATRASDLSDGFKAHYEYDGIKYYLDQNGIFNEILDENEYLIHFPSEAVIENEREADCEHNGNYESVIYCKHCGSKVEISRSKHIIKALGHNYIESYITNETSPSCDVPGGYDTIYICIECGNIKTIHNTIPSLGHCDEKETGFCDICGKFIPGSGGSVVIGKGGSDLYYVSEDKINWELVNGNNVVGCTSGILYIRPIESDKGKYRFSSSGLNSYVDEEGITVIRVDGPVIVTAVSTIVPTVNEGLNIFERIVKFIRELFDRIKQIFS